MTTVVVVKKDRQVAIAADSLVTFGDTKLAPDLEANDKLFEVNGSWFGLAGSMAHFPVMKSALASLGADLKLRTRGEVFDSFRAVHELLKDKYFLNTKEDDDDPYESMQVTCMIANTTGIYGVYSYREVFSFDKFWGLGSGRNFALGAMHYAYPKLKTAEAIARAGVEAGAALDKSSALPYRMQILELADI
jgi:ATP-dependent HslUV protease, peptidase subunit HslV